MINQYNQSEIIPTAHKATTIYKKTMLTIIYEYKKF